MNEIEVIPCVVDKNDENGSFTSCDNAKLVEIGGGYAHTLTTHEPSMSNHHCNMAIVKVKENTSKGYSECKIDGVCDLSYPDSKTRRGRVQDNGDTCPTITAESNGLCKIEKLGQVSNEGSQSGTVVSENGLMPNLCAGTHGYCNANIVTQYRIEENIIIGGEQKNQAIKKDGICTTLCSAMGCGGGYVPMTTEQYRIRKLTPKECWRLMGFTDEDFSKAEKVNSNTQLYKQAGNSIVVNVLEALFAQLF